ncbi:LNK1-like protein [Drosera capensis]
MQVKLKGHKLLNAQLMVLGKDLWNNSFDEASCDCSPTSNNRAFNSGSDAVADLSTCLNSLMESVGGELYAEDPVGGDQGAAMEANLHRYSLSQATPAENDLNFFNGNHWDKEESDMSYYGWPGIENFEDVDRIYRTCDSATGPGIVYDDGLGWFSSAQAVEGSKAALNPTFRFQVSDADILSTVTEGPEVSRHNINPVTNDGDMKPVPSKASTKKLAANDPPVGTTSSITNESEIMLQIDRGKQINPHGFRVKHQKSSGRDNSEERSWTSMRQRDSSYTTNFSRPVQSSDDFPLQNLTTSGVQEKGLSHQPGAGDEFMAQTAVSGSLSCQEEVPNRETGAELYSELDGYSMGIQAELDSFNMQESCSVNPLFDEASQEAVSFHNLQHVMEQLDSRTKLCIRDSLYRLARSAEQRNECGNSANGSIDEQDAGPSTSDGTNKYDMPFLCTGLMDMETDTNPIDRSIAHLLFHRPSGSSDSSYY